MDADGRAADAGLLDRVLAGDADLGPEAATSSAAAASPWLESSGCVEATDDRRAAVRARATRAVATIDALIARQLDAVLHHPALQRLESLWRGTAWLVGDMADDSKLKVRIFDARWGEVVRDLERAPTFDQSVLFTKLYSDEFGMPGGEPYGMVVIDHQVWHKLGGRERTDDIAALAGLAEVAAACFCPFALSVDPRIAGMDGFDDIDLRQDLGNALSGPEYALWERLRAQPDTRFICAVMPRLLGRARYTGRDRWRPGFVYEERIASHADMLWISGGFGLAQVAARAMRVHRWPAAIRGGSAANEGGIVDGPVRQFLDSDRRGYVARFATENAISEDQEVAMNAAGLICLRQLHLTGAVAFLNLPSLHKPPEYDGEEATMNAKMGAMVNYIMCVARFAHYVKVMARDWVGKYTDAEECRRLLQDWLKGYTTGNDDASAEMRIKYPLRQAQVQVSEIIGKPGSYTCEIAIRPHYQLDQIASEFRLTTEIGRELGR